MTEAGVAPAAVAGRGLLCQFGPVRAVDDLSFEVAEGEVFGLLGPNGGSTTCPAADLVDGARLDLLPSDDIRADNHRPDHH